ncbi:hypothetical protein [Solwaraspora sp. WMMD792]|uniref:hypothetical protein n=1 Tax=Solwaraspora sp. WMMD792 TaxID=3016099 RepID=UPI00241711FF|nr:hypothetical protein [Solwaraspora sp. WMMD792]MDG4769764.1 hypothetical protein [Solwaraspora sp. WMMD792]
MVIAALVACSAPGDDDLDDGPSEPTRKALSFAAVEDLGPACEDIEGGYPDAPEYVGDGPHPMAVLVNEFDTDVQFNDPDYREWKLMNNVSTGDPLDKPDSPSEVTLLACGFTRPGDDLIDKCSYKAPLGLTASIEYPLYNKHYTMVVYELHTGREVARAELDARFRQSTPTCPFTVEGNFEKIYARSLNLHLYEPFRDLVTEPAT